MNNWNIQTVPYSRGAQVLKKHRHGVQILGTRWVKCMFQGPTNIRQYATKYTFSGDLVHLPYKL